MSSIVRVFGTYAERVHIQKKLYSQLVIDEGLVVRATSSERTLYARSADTSFNECDVISVSCKTSVCSFEPGEEKDSVYIDDDYYLSPDYLVILRGEDTILYYIQKYVPQARAEGGMIRGLEMLGTAITAAVLGLALSLLFGFSWWSALVSIGLALAVIVYYLFLSRPFWSVIAALRGAVYIWWQVLKNGRSRKDYQEFVSLLGDSEEYYLVPIHRILRSLI